MTGISSGILRALRALLTRRITVVCDRIPYEFAGLPYRKILNWILTEASVICKPPTPWGLPTHLQVEPTTACNLACTLCPVTAGMDRPRQHLSLEAFREVVDELSDSLLLILLWDWGEPFMNPAAFEMIAYAKSKGIKVVSSTNGHFFAKPDQVDRLILSGLDTVIFAMDGITQETYQHYRQGGDLETVLQGIRNVVARKRELGSPTPLVNLRFIVMKHNEHEVPRLKVLAEEIGADVLTLKTLNPCAQDPYDAAIEAPLHDDMLPDNPLWRRFRCTESGERLRRRHNPCRNLWNASTIHAGGVVCPCTYDPKEAYALGDITERSFPEIWSGPAYRRMRDRFRRDWGGIGLCRDCSYAYVGGDCATETMAEAIFFNRHGGGGR